MKTLGKQRKWIFSFTVLAIFIASACSLDSPAITQVSSHKQDIDYEPNYTATSDYNDIESIRVVCYLHLKTAQVQIDINYVGSSNLLGEKIRTSTVFEQILIRGSIRNVQVIESSSIQLEHSELLLENGTLIQFVLSSTIPVGVKRNVKITYLQDTTELASSYSYYLGVDWLRRIGSHHILIICDEDISLTKCIPSPHSISSSNGMLTLSWLQVNPENFYSLLNYTRKLVLDRLLVSPQSLDLGKVRKNRNELEQVFEIFNNESTILDGTIIVPEWATTNVTNWELSIGEKMFVSITINISEARTLNGFIVIQCSIESLPLRILITVEVIEGLGTAGLVLIILSGVVVVSVIGLFIIITVRRKRKSVDEIEKIPKEEEKMVTQVFDLTKWKEILTDKEFVIFSELLNHDELTQTDLCRITSLSKSTVSRAISRLVAKGLIEKKKYGISNFISIKRTIDN